MQVNRAAHPTASTPPSTPPSASSRGAEAYRSDWQSPSVTPALHTTPSVSPSPRTDGVDSFQQRAANDQGAAVPFAPGTRNASDAQPTHLATLSPVTATAASSEPRLAANDAPDLNQVHTNALLAKDVYNDVPSPPAGYRAAGATDLARLGLTAEMLEQPGESSFRARVYVSGEAGQERYTVVFRGSQSGDDWKSNAQQGLGLNSTHYANALEIGKKLARTDADVTLVGHSLGGGLAAEAAIASGRPADTFNAAGLHQNTIDQARAVAQANDRGLSSINNYRVPGEILTTLQEGGDRAIGAGIGGLISGGSGAILGGAVLDLPEAVGTQHDLPNVRPEGAHWWDSINPVDRHSMDWVLAGTAAQAGR
ncbi:MAG: hypothetical protein MT490_09765 [Sphingomonas sp.]|uniref:hypothetical protein n=1 Tax=Sphingomonas sp. TaxID=28214 RepID=UPI00227501F3|nr:hypothetical protein [Sphingomonas sp.]MCX8476070.1 hypothetical protein [Sphingomonas sp.]